MANELNRLLARAYTMKTSGQSPDKWLREEIVKIEGMRKEAADEIDRLTAIIKRRGSEACHLTSVYHALLTAALKEKEETNEPASSNRRSAGSSIH